MLVLLLSASYNKREEADMEKGKRILLVLLFVILAAMGIMAGTFLAGGGLKPRPGLDRGEKQPRRTQSHQRGRQPRRRLARK